MVDPNKFWLDQTNILHFIAAQKERTSSITSHNGPTFQKWKHFWHFEKYLLEKSKMLVLISNSAESFTNCPDENFQLNQN